MEKLVNKTKRGRTFC